MIKKSLFAGALLCLLMVMGCTASSSSSAKLNAVDNVVPRVPRLAYWKPVYLITPDIVIDGRMEAGSGRRIQQVMQDHMVVFARGIQAPHQQFGNEREAMDEAVAAGSRYAFFAYFNESSAGGYTATMRVFDLKYGGLEHPVIDRSIKYAKGSSELSGDREALSKRLYKKLVDDAYGPG